MDFALLKKATKRVIGEYVDAFLEGLMDFIADNLGPVYIMFLFLWGVMSALASSLALFLIGVVTPPLAYLILKIVYTAKQMKGGE